MPILEITCKRCDFVLGKVETSDALSAGIKAVQNNGVCAECAPEFAVARDPDWKRLPRAEAQAAQAAATTLLRERLRAAVGPMTRPAKETK